MIPVTATLGGCVEFFLVFVGLAFWVVPAFVGRPASLVFVAALVPFISTAGLHGVFLAVRGVRFAFSSRFVK